MAHTELEYITLDQYIERYEKEINNAKLSVPRAEKSFRAEIGKKPKYHKGVHGKQYDSYTCGQCGKAVSYGVMQNYCWNCGYQILWDSPRCLTKYEDENNGKVYVDREIFKGYA